jgi:urease accessory protein
MRLRSGARWRCKKEKLLGRVHLANVASLGEHNEIFAANRAVGRIALSVTTGGGRSRRTRVSEQGSLRVRFPNSVAGECEAVIVNTAGGIAGGDRFDLDFEVGEGARLAVSGAAAEKVYRSLGADAEITVRLKVAAGAALRWLPQETILFDQALLNRHIEINLERNASIVLAEAVMFGRAAMGETVEQGKLLDRWRVRHDGRLIFSETLRLVGGIAEKLAEPAVLNAGVALATILIVPGDETLATKLRAGQFTGEVGISAWNGIALARLCAHEGATLRGDLVQLLTALDRGPLPRLWLH